MQAARIAVVGTFALLTGGCVAPAAFGGPLPVRNNHPAQLLVLHLPTAGAAVLPAGEIAAGASAAYTSLFLRGAAPGRTFVMDGEYLRVRPHLRAGLGDGLEVGAAVPFAYAAGGFLDGFLIGYHELFSLPDYGRDGAARDDFRVEATENGQTVFQVRPHHLELLDLPLTVTWCFDRPDDGFGLALRAGLELPTGSHARGYGNGDVDWSVGLVSEHRLEQFAWTAHVQHTFVNDSPASPGSPLRLADVTSIGAELELPLTDRLAALAQLEFETSTLRRLELERVEREQVLLWVGGRYRVGERSSLEVAFGEDLRSHVSPDFTAWIGFVVGL